MNKQDLAAIRKEIKIENNMLKVNEIYSVYLKKDDGVVIHSELDYFENFDSEKQEIYLKNFKKILSGSLDTKLFELDFLKEDSVGVEDKYHARNILYSAVKEEKDGFIAAADRVVTKLAENFKYETDVIITFIRAEYWKGASSRRRKEAEIAIDDNVFAFQFMMCSINKIDPPKKGLQFDFLEMKFKVNSILDGTVNLNAPLDGFMFPCFNNNCADINRIMYYTAKPKDINMSFVQEVLNCDFKKTAENEKEEFSSILRAMVGDTITPNTMQNIYENLSKKLEEDEEDEVDSQAVLVSLKDVQAILEESGLEKLEGLEEAYKQVLGDTNFEFKVKNIVPDMNTKSMKISTESINLTFIPKELKSIRKVKDSQGKICLLIELTDDVNLEGFALETEDI
ncbi:MAG: DUF4317 family protein [Clostridiaceae bacterium]|nr:DUF4317 family protein [Clostridiaceae bacterium]